MTGTPAHRYTVEIAPSDHGGSAWLVRVYRKGFFRKKLISSDWFLDEDQARRYAAQISGTLGSPELIDLVRSRPPGWTLHRPSH